MNIVTNERTNGRVGGRAGGPTNERVKERMNERPNERSRRTKERTKERCYERTNQAGERTNERTNEPRDERTNERTNVESWRQQALLLSMPTTASLRSSNLRVTWKPMKPAAPVTKYIQGPLDLPMARRLIPFRAVFRLSRSTCSVLVGK